MASNTPKKSKIAEGMDAFFTEERASEGVRFPLRDPLGRETDHWLQIIGMDSEEFRMIDAQMRRKATTIAQLKDDDERDRATIAMTREMTARLVKAWSFDAECNLKNVTEFFKKAPQIQHAVDRAVANRSLFYKVESENSSSISKPNSDSTSS